MVEHFICALTEGKSQEELEAEEQEEEEEAKNIQKRLAANLSEEDYDLNFFQVFCVNLVCLPAAYSTSADSDTFVCLLTSAVSLQEFALEEEQEEKKGVEKEEKIVKDLKQMSQKEKMKLLKKESPELLELIQDFKTKVRHADKMPQHVKRLQNNIKLVCLCFWAAF